jgi:mRNA interferase MazF
VVLDPVVGSEQGKTRPALVISNQILPVINVLPITTKKPARRTYPNEAFLPAGTGGLKNDSLVLCYQVRTVDKGRLQKHIGKIVNESIQKAVQAALKFQLDLA